eukprot:3295214-Rhodomonas_salina.2
MACVEPGIHHVRKQYGVRTMRHKLIKFYVSPAIAYAEPLYCLRACYAVPGTDLAYGATREMICGRVRCTISRTTRTSCSICTACRSTKTSRSVNYASTPFLIPKLVLREVYLDACASTGVGILVPLPVLTRGSEGYQAALQWELDSLQVKRCFSIACCRLKQDVRRIV